MFLLIFVIPLNKLNYNNIIILIFIYLLNNTLKRFKNKLNIYLYYIYNGNNTKKRIERNYY